MSWSPQRSPQVSASARRYLPFTAANVSIAFFSNIHLSRALPPPISTRPAVPPCSLAGKINLETHSPHLSGPSNLFRISYYSNNLMLLSKIFDHTRSHFLSNLQ